ncbi:RICIN domain-containing protein [Streptomyces sp. R35]|uniref:RICIN domain-containing protein n=1 Tax=Streptomyces sp. R35 TaxID=3238630 RepID=A0AB39SDH5_9ACTN
MSRTKIRTALVAGAAVAAGLSFGSTQASATALDYFTWVNSKSNTCMSTYAAGTTNNTAAIVYDCNGSFEQLWEHDSQGRLVNDKSGKCLSTYAAGTANNTLVIIYDCNNGDEQRWNYSSGQLVNAKSGKCLSTYAAGTANSTKLVIYTCNGENEQYWI